MNGYGCNSTVRHSGQVAYRCTGNVNTLPTTLLKLSVMSWALQAANITSANLLTRTTCTKSIISTLTDTYYMYKEELAGGALTATSTSSSRSTKTRMRLTMLHTAAMKISKTNE
eukprot:scpid74744/ scgid27544/ 